MSRGEWDDLIVLCAANGWDTTKVVDQHMAEQLSATVPVLYVDPPISRLSVLRNPELRASLEGPRLRVIAPRLARLTPVVQPFPERRGSVTLTTAILRRQLGRAAASLGGSVRALVSAWPLFPVLGACRERSRVYWAQDDFVGLAELSGTDGKLVDRREQQVAAAADIVVAANPLVAETWQSRGLDVRIIPFGCDADAYAHVDDLARPSDVTSEPPVVGFVGRINERIDPSLLEAIADAWPFAAVRRSAHPVVRVGSTRRPPRAAERLLDRARALRRTAAVLLGHRRRRHALRRLGVQPGQLSPEDARVPRGRTCGREHRSPGDALAGHRPRDRRIRARGVRRCGRPRAARARARRNWSRAGARSRRRTAGPGGPPICSPCSTSSRRSAVRPLNDEEEGRPKAPLSRTVVLSD